MKDKLRAAEPPRRGAEADPRHQEIKLSIFTVRLLVLVLCLSAASDLCAQEARASFDRSTIFEGETVTLTITLDDQLRRQEPDLSPLKKDFEVLISSASTQLQIIGNRQTAQTRWRIELAPKRRGNIRVPSLTIGSKRTAPVTLKVLAQPKGSKKQKKAEEVFLEVQAEPKNPYVQAQVRLSVRFFYAVPLLEGSLDEPKLANTVLERLGGEINYETTRNGRRYDVIERRYALFAEKSGQLTIPALRFRGRVADAGSARSSLNALLYRGGGRRVLLNSEPIVLQVRPRPATYQGQHWLPSQELTLQEAWSQNPPQFRVGEPVTRILTLEAKGLSTSQLPELQMPEIPQTRVYPDQPVTAGRSDNGWMISRLEQRIAVVPTEAGQFTLPEVQLSWWDTQADKERVVALPARTITVLAAVGKAPLAPVVPLAKAVEPVPTVPSSLSVPSLGSPTPAGFWPGLSAVLLVLWLITLWAWWRARRRSLPPQVPMPASAAPEVARRALRQACRRNDAPEAASALLAWAAASWPEYPPQSLGALAERLTADSAALVQELDRSLYAADALEWQEGSALWAAVKKGLVKKPRSPVSRQADLPPLYPERV